MVAQAETQPNLELFFHIREGDYPCVESIQALETLLAAVLVASLRT